MNGAPEAEKTLRSSRTLGLFLSVRCYRHAGPNGPEEPGACLREGSAAYRAAAVGCVTVAAICPRPSRAGRRRAFLFPLGPSGPICL